MFGDLFNIKEKLEKAKKEVLDTKERLNHVYVDKTSPCGAIRVRVTGNKQVEDISFDLEKLPAGENPEIILKQILNEALKEAGEIQETELKNAFTKHMPSIPGLDGLL